MGLLAGQAHRLSAHEDARFGHIHKVLGLLVLGNFAWRLYLVATTGTAGLGWAEGGASGLGWLAVHAALHLSSFQSTLENRRNLPYNAIWPEMRLHTATFAARSIAIAAAMVLASAHPASGALDLARVWALARLLPLLPHAAAGPLTALVLGHVGAAQAVRALYPMRFAVVVLTMIAADLATARFGGGSTAIRGSPPPGRDMHPAALRVLRTIYSASQAGGTIICLCSGSVSAVFFVLLPIQTAPLLMTLIKKGVLRQAGWHLWYSLSLLVVFFVAYRATDAPAGSAMVTQAHAPVMIAAFAAARFAFHANKYLLWAVAAAFARCANRGAPA